MIIHRVRNPRVHIARICLVTEKPHYSVPGAAPNEVIFRFSRIHHCGLWISGAKREHLEVFPLPSPPIAICCDRRHRKQRELPFRCVRACDEFGRTYVFQYLFFFMLFDDKYVLIMIISNRSKHINVNNHPESIWFGVRTVFVVRSHGYTQFCRLPIDFACRGVLSGCCPPTMILLFNR